MEKLCYVSGELHNGTKLPDAGFIIVKATEFGNVEVFQATPLPSACPKVPEDMLVLVKILQCCFEVFKCHLSGCDTGQYI